MSAVIHQPGEGEILQMGPNRLVIKATSEMTAGSFFEVAAPAGTFVCAPPGTVHTFRNDSDAAVRFLNFNTTGGLKDYMRDLAAAAASGTPPTPQEIGRIASRYDFVPA